LWPGASAPSGEKNIKVNLHRLRKALQSKPDDMFGWSYIQLKNNFISLTESLFEVDYLLFEEYVEHAISLYDSDISESIRLFQKAEILYHGEFLPEELYNDIISRKRTSLNLMYMQLLEKMASYYEGIQDLTHAIYYYNLILEHDSLNDNACIRLMKMFRFQGKSNHAIRVFQTYRQNLQNEIDTEPDQEILELFHSLSIS